jgi:putative acetyltransferase
MIRVRPADSFDPACAALLAESPALMRSLFAQDDMHVLGPDALASPNVRFLAAGADGRVVGISEIALFDGYAEVKSMFTDPRARGLGVADAVLRALIDGAEAEGRTALRLETGRDLDAVLSLYARHGFVPRGPIGASRASAASPFFERVAE